MKYFFYKREVSWQRPDSPLAEAPARWDAFFGAIARRGFNGFVIYSVYHPFQFILDYRGFPGAAEGDAAGRRRTREQLNRVLSLAHRRGLTTFLQHYVGHFTSALGRRLGIGIEESAATRLAGFEHPVIRAYQRYCYREIFRQCPDLDGLYFNYESCGANADLVLDTAIREANRMRRKPVFLHRLWGFNVPRLMRRLVAGYRGPTLLSHKISDTKDTYFYPAADTRLREWQRHVPGAPALYEVGPCHNCAANLARTLWSDYDFVRDILDDAASKGCDGFSFHQVNDAAAADTVLGRLNALHLEAMTDFIRGVRKDRRQQVAALAAATGARGRNAGRLFRAITAASRPLILAHQQFCVDSACDGWLNPGRHSLTQEPFFYYPATELNDQTRLLWSSVRTDTSWLKKTERNNVTPPRYTQYILDYVNPSRPRALLTPSAVAAQIRRDCGTASAAIRSYQAGPGAVRRSEVEPYIRAHCASGLHVAHEILAATETYALYFAATRPMILRHIDRALEPLGRDRRLAAVKLPEKPKLWYAGMPAPAAIEKLRMLRRFVADGRFCFDAFRAFVKSHVEYNEIRRTARAFRLLRGPVLAAAGRQLRLSLRFADEAAARARRTPQEAACVAWRDYVRLELERLRPPEVECPSRGSSAAMRLYHDDCFRTGEDHLDDFLGFFALLDYGYPSDLRCSLSRGDAWLTVTLEERGMDPKERRARWREFAHSSDLTYVMRLHFDVGNRAREVRSYMVMPLGGRAYRAGFEIRGGRDILHRPLVLIEAGKRIESREWDDGYSLAFRIPLSELGVARTRGVWGFNITANPSIRRNRQYTWSAQYDAGCGNPCLFGKLRFT